MAFLCPVRIRRGKMKNKMGSDPTQVNRVEDDYENGDNQNMTMGRITGSSSIETLVRVGLEKEAGISPDSRMIVLHDFTPCVDDELPVKRGAIVNVLYRENDWVYVILNNPENNTSSEGFIPHSYCAPYSSNTHGDNSQQNKSKEEISNIETASVQSEPFFKDPSNGEYIVLYKFTARDENDLNVERGELVTVLNKTDPDWYYILRSDGAEGFIPSGFVFPLSTIESSSEAQKVHSSSSNNIQKKTSQSGNSSTMESKVKSSSKGYKSNKSVNNSNSLESNKKSNSTLESNNNNTNAVNNNMPIVNTNNSNNSSSSSNNKRFEPDQVQGTELVMLYDYKAQAPDDLSVRRGDWVYADLTNQTVEGWIWAYSAKKGQYGFIPRCYARQPATTSL